MTAGKSVFYDCLTGAVFPSEVMELLILDNLLGPINYWVFFVFFSLIYSTILILNPFLPSQYLCLLHALFHFPRSRIENISRAANGLQTPKK